MNWMGGVRNRLKVKNDRKRQQDFFEKQKFTSKVRKLETSTNPPKRKQAVSLDLLSLQAANFSAAHYKKNGTGIRSSGRINRIDLDKSQALLRQKFVNLPDASPESKPSILNLSKPSPQESVVCPKLYPTSRRNPLSTITEDKSPSVTDISSQDLSQMVNSQKEQSNIWTSTPADFWHKRKRPKSRNVLLDSKHSIRQGDDHDGVKKEPYFHSPSTSEKLLLDGSRNQMRIMDDTLDSDYWAGKTPGSSTSAWSDLSTIMEDTDDATVPSIEDDDFNYRDVGSNQVSSQSFPESLQSRDVPTSGWTSQTAGEEPMVNAPDSTLSSFKDCHKIEYPIGGFNMGDSTRIIHPSTASEQYSSTGKIHDCQVEKYPHTEHITSDIHPANIFHAQNATRAVNMDPAFLRDQLNAPKVRKRVQVVEQPQSRNQMRNTDHQSTGHAQQRTLFHQYADIEEQRDLACRESTSFTSPEDSGTYLMTQRAKIDNYMQHPGLEEAGQRHNLHRDTSWQYPNPRHSKVDVEDENAVGRQASTLEPTSNTYSSNDGHDQMKNMRLNEATVKKFTRGQIPDHQDKQVDIMNLYSSETKQILPAVERQVDMMQVQPCSKNPLMLAQIQDNGETSLVDNQDHDNRPSTDVDGDESVVSDEDDAESSSGTDCSSTDESPDNDLLPDTDASSINNWLDFVHADVSESINRTDTERKATDLQGDDRILIKDVPATVPATAQQMLEEVLALDRQLHKETLAAETDDVGERTCVFLGGKERTVEKLSGRCSKSPTEATLEGVQDGTSPDVPKLKTVLASSAKNSSPKEVGKEHEAQSTDMKGRHGQEAEVTVSSDVSSSQTEDPAASLLKEKSPEKNTSSCGSSIHFACETSSLQTDVTSETDAIISSTVAIKDEDRTKTPSVVSTSTSTETLADSKTKGEKVVHVCDSSVQCALIGDPLPMPQGRGDFEDADSCIQASDIDEPCCFDIITESSACDSVTETQSSHENDFESCVSTP